MSFYSPATVDSGLLQQLSNDELKQRLNDDDQRAKLDELVKDSQQVKALEQERDMLIASNKSLAEYNLQREPSYRQARQILMNAYNEAKIVKEEVEKKKIKLTELSRQTSLDTTLALMQTAAAEAEEESENIASAFLAGEMNLSQFLKEFLEKKKLAHQRRIKTEKLMEVVRNETHHEIGGTSSIPFQPVRAAPPPPSYGGPAGGQIPPYPVYPQSMPQPTYPFSRPPAYR